MEDNHEATVISVETLHPHDEAVLEYGKQTFLSSSSAAQDFCKSMITISTGAIPVYLAVFDLFYPESRVPDLIDRTLIAVPSIVFLAATCIFFFGYRPWTDVINLNDLNDIRQQHQNAIRRRAKYINIGTVFFVSAVLSAIVAVAISPGI